MGVLETPHLAEALGQAEGMQEQRSHRHLIFLCVFFNLGSLKSCAKTKPRGT